MKIIFITPCSRVFNIPLIFNELDNLKGFDWEWIIVLDKAAPEYFASDRILRNLPLTDRVTVLKPDITKSFVGHSLRNYALRYLEENPLINYPYYICQLDDDTIPHEHFDRLSDILNDYYPKTIVFNQAYRDGGMRLITDTIPIFGRCDTGTFLVSRHHAHGLRYNESEYAGDYLYIKELFDKFPDFVKPTEDKLGYYNWITDEDLTFNRRS